MMGPTLIQPLLMPIPRLDPTIASHHFEEEDLTEHLTSSKLDPTLKLFAIVQRRGT